MYAAMQCASQAWLHVAIIHFEHRQLITLQEQSNRELWPNITSQPPHPANDFTGKIGLDQIRNSSLVQIGVIIRSGQKR
jgi:hypothetical protein